jgi:hypothetical protein
VTSPLAGMHEATGVRWSGGDPPIPRNYGEPEAEYTAARDAVAIVDRADRRFLRVYGRDPARMIQGLITNDVNLAGPGRAVYAAVLTAKGKMVADVRVLRRGEELLLETDAGAAGPLAEHLRRFVPPAVRAVRGCIGRHCLHRAPRSRGRRCAPGGAERDAPGRRGGGLGDGGGAGRHLRHGGGDGLGRRARLGRAVSCGHRGDAVAQAGACRRPAHGARHAGCAAHRGRPAPVGSGARRVHHPAGGRAQGTGHQRDERLLHRPGSDHPGPAPGARELASPGRAPRGCVRPGRGDAAVPLR